MDYVFVLGVLGVIRTCLTYLWTMESNEEYDFESEECSGHND